MAVSFRHQRAQNSALRSPARRIRAVLQTRSLAWHMLKLMVQAVVVAAAFVSDARRIAGMRRALNELRTTQRPRRLPVFPA